MTEIPPGIVAGMSAILGLLVGSFLNVVAHRVPRGESVVSPPSACPQCGTPIRNRHNVPVLGWLVLRGRCYDCGLPISARYPVVEAATGLLFGLVGFHFADRPMLLAAYLAFAAIAIALALIDLDVHRLPNVIVLPSYPVLGVLLALGAGADDLLRAAMGAAVLFGFFLVVAVVAPGGIGLGDVKLAGVVGGMTAAISWGAFVTGAFGAFLLGAIAGVLLMLGRRASGKTAVPFGPFMLLGAWAAVLGAGHLGDAYLAMLAS